MSCGKKEKRVTFQARSAGQAAGGQPVDTWTDAFTLWARVQASSASENYAAKQFNPEVTHVVTVEWSRAAETITPLHRASCDGKFFDILGIEPGERDLDDLRINCKERVLGISQ
jgi:SPP1 family predicted phage head-tail adaptor